MTVYLSFFELMNVSSASLADSMPERIVEVGALCVWGLGRGLVVRHAALTRKQWGQSLGDPSLALPLCRPAPCLPT